METPSIAGGASDQRDIVRRLSLDIASSDQSEPHVQVVDLGPGVELSLLESFAPLTVSASKRDIDDGPSDEIRLVSSVGQGAVQLRQDDEQVRLSRGTALFYASHLPFVWQGLAEHGVTMNLALDRRLLRAEAGVSAPTLKHLDASPVVLRVMNKVMREILEAPADLSSTDHAALRDTVVDLSVALVRGQARASVAAAVPTGRRALLMLLQESVRLRVSDPSLTPGDLAATHFISLRHLHEVFSDQDTSPATYIRRQRLALACRLLADPSHVRTRSSNIALWAGFTEPRTFTRAFRREFGMSPEDYRSQAMTALRGRRAAT